MLKVCPWLVEYWRIVVTFLEPVFHFGTSHPSAAFVSGLERTCVMCVKGRPVEFEPVSMVPAVFFHLYRETLKKSQKNKKNKSPTSHSIHSSLFSTRLPFFFLILSQLHRCLIRSPYCVERTEHLSSFREGQAAMAERGALGFTRL